MRVHGVLIVVLDFFINEIYKSFAGNMIKYCFYFEIKFWLQQKIFWLIFLYVIHFRLNENGEPKGPIVKTLKSRHKGPVEDGVTTINLGPLCRKLGLAWLMTDPNLWCVKDICGWVCAIFTWLLVLYAEYVVNFVMLLHNPNTTWSIVNGLIFQFFAFMAVASHVRCMLTDPVSTRLIL